MKWEYRVAKIPEDTEWEVWLNQFGGEGWELVSFLPNRDHVFKRPVSTVKFDPLGYVMEEPQNWTFKMVDGEFIRVVDKD